MPAIQPPEHTCITVPHFLQIAQNYWGEAGWVFRGQANIEWPLLPKAGREDHFLIATDVWEERGQTSSDLGRFNLWREQAVAFTDSLPENDFECLAFAQHYGLATRLLDWSTNPLVALFFAAETQSDADGAVFCHMPWWVIDQKELSLLRPMDQAALLVARPFDRRIVAQSGVFTYHTDPRKPLSAAEVVEEARGAAPEGIDLVVIRVPAAAKSMLQRKLSAVGITRKSLFPDLEGLSAFVNWGTRKTVQGRERRKNEDPKN